LSDVRRPAARLRLTRYAPFALPTGQRDRCQCRQSRMIWSTCRRRPASIRRRG